MESVPPGKLPVAEYDRRKEWLSSINNLSTSEYIEIVRILKKHSEELSENTNGFFFNVASIKQETFDALQLFLEFTVRNKKELAEHEQFLSTLISPKK